MYKILDSIESPSDIKGLGIDELRELCSEIRHYMVDVCSRNPGHLGSSLGAVELIVGMHYVFDTPQDRIVFDVGHQAYAHKILTGRREAFRNLRTSGGISGFPSISESEYDAFGVGHSSTSISAALGLAEAARLQGTDRKVVALIGDGSLTGGMAFEGLNNAGVSKADLLVILNDNDHSIDDSRGALHRHLLKITTSTSYNTFKTRIWDLLGDSDFRHFIQRWTRSMKSWFVRKNRGDLFESLGIRYFGPVDGNDIETVINVLSKLKGLKGPRLLHAVTVKGKGFEAAEADPTTWHAPGKFNPVTGERIRNQYSCSRYQDVFGEVLTDLAGKDRKIAGITPAMASGCGMTEFAKKFPERFYDVGIEEEHAVTFSAGLAKEGMKPVCNIYSAFSQRAYDQIIHDIALQNLPVLLCFDRAGLVGEDGATHHGAFDIAAYRSVPNMIISAPSNELELKNLMYTALTRMSGPFIIRYPRGLAEGVAWRDAGYEEYEIGKALEVAAGSDIAIVATGPAVNRATEAAAQFDGKVGVYNFRFVKPLDKMTLERICNTYKRILTIEDGCMAGGLYGAVCEWVASSGKAVSVSGSGIADSFVAHAGQTEQREACGLTAESISEKLKYLLEKS